MKHMNELEQRLEQASQEVRQAAGHSIPPPIEEKSRFTPRGWMVFAAAFGAVIVAVGVLPLLSRSGDPDPIGSSLPTTTLQEGGTTVAAESTTTSVGRAEFVEPCSAAGLPHPAEQDDLPAPVAETRDAIATAAIDCYFDALGRLAGVGPNGREGPELITSFGGGGFMNIVEWESDGEKSLALLVKLLDLPYATQDIEGTRYYVWPSAFIYDSWEEIPTADLEVLRSIYTEEELDQIAAFGSYAGWRIGITEDGDWKFFVAGD